MAIAVEEAARGKEIVWGAPTYDQVRVAWDETRRAAAGVATFNQTVMLAAFPGGGKIHFRSLDNPDNARGRTADGVVIDESGDVSEVAWYEVLRPMLVDTGGWLWAIGTPKGRNWFWREFAMAGERGDSAAWNAPTLGCRYGLPLERVPHPLENPHIPFAEIEHMAATLPERVFRQEILAEFIDESGGVFRNVAESVDIGRRGNEPPTPHSRHSLGVDLARVQDFTVLTVLDGEGRQVYHDRFNQISWERQIGTILQVAAQYHAHVWMDSTGVGDPLYEAVRKAWKHVTGYQFTNASKECLIDNLAMGLEQGRYRLMDLPSQTNELMAYQYELTPSRNVRMNAPEGMHDDCVIGLALAAWGHYHPALDRTVRYGPSLVAGHRG